MSWVHNLSNRQNEISQKYIDDLEVWLRDIYPAAADNIISQFIDVYSQLLSTTGNKKTVPADLFKLDAYWNLQKTVKAELDSFGGEIHSRLNVEFRAAYIAIYEGIAPDDKEKTCYVDDRIIQRIVNKPWGKYSNNIEDRIWINLSVLMDELFGELMNSVIKQLPLDDFDERLLIHFKKSRKFLNTTISDCVTRIQAHSVIQRSKDDKATSSNPLEYYNSYISTYGSEEEVSAYSMALAEVYDVMPAYEGEYEDDWYEEDEDWWEEEEDEEVYVTIVVEMDDVTCDECAELDGYTCLEEEAYGLIPVHPNCRCTIVGAEDGAAWSFIEGMARPIADRIADIIIRIIFPFF